MVDTRTGNIYKLPINATNTGNFCTSTDNIFDRYLFLPNSKLLIASICKEKRESNQTKIEQTFFIYRWDETKKQFMQIDKLNKAQNL